MAERLRQDPLPPPWSYGVMSDGRIFFINEETAETTWLHPVTSKAIGSGLNDRNDLPQGWQEGITPSGKVYYIDHLDETTTFYHPLTGKSEMDEEYPDQLDSSEFNNPERAPNADGKGKSTSLSQRPSFLRKKVPKTITPSVKRNRNAEVEKEGWLYKKDNGPLGVWRKKWCVLADFFLFYYKDVTDENHVGSVMLPSYEVVPVGPRDKVTRKFAFKCEHNNMRTYYFAGSSQRDMESWRSALYAASRMQIEKNQRKTDEEEWGRTTSPRSVLPPSNTLPPSNRSSLSTPTDCNPGHDSRTRIDPYQTIAIAPVQQNGVSRQNRPEENGMPPPREGEGTDGRGKNYAEIPGSNHSRQQQQQQQRDPDSEWSRARPRSLGPSDYQGELSRTQSLLRDRDVPPTAGHRFDPYGTMPRNASKKPPPGPPPTYVDPQEIQFRKRQRENSEAPRRRGESNRESNREPSVISYPSVFGSIESDPPGRPPYPASYNNNGGGDVNANYAKSPPQQQNQVFQNKQILASTPEQRSFVQGPMQQTPPSSIVPEQRNVLNSPMSNGPGSYDRSSSMSQARRSPRPSNGRGPPISRQRSYPGERVPPAKMTSEVQMSRSAAPQLHTTLSQRSINSHSGQSPQTRNGRDSVDIAPSRGTPPVLDKSSSMREIRGGDQLAPLQVSRVPPGSNRTQTSQPPTRFHMWQKKAQPYILLSTGIRLRLSIAANDLLGKSHEELVLFLIQLRRDKANMDEWLTMIDEELKIVNDPAVANGNYAKLRPRHSDSMRRSLPLSGRDEFYEEELRREREEITLELEIGLPLINLVDNLVRMGSLYGGQNEMIAQEFYKNQAQKSLPPAPAKRMIQYSRQMEEEKLMNDIEQDYKKAQSAEERELDEKLRKLRELDQKLQEISSNVYVLKEEKDKMENTMEGLSRRRETEWDNKDILADIEDNQQSLDRQLIKVRSQLAQGTKDLEDISNENTKLEHEIALLKMRRDKGRPTENGYYPGDRELMEIRDEVSTVQNKMGTLDRKRAQLVKQMASLRKDTNGAPEKPPTQPEQQSFNFQSTDLDTDEMWDMSASDTLPAPPNAQNNQMGGAQSRLGRPQDLHIQQQNGYGQPGQRNGSVQLDSGSQQPYRYEEPIIGQSQPGEQHSPPKPQQQQQQQQQVNHVQSPNHYQSPHHQGQYPPPQNRMQSPLDHRRTTDPRRTPTDPRRTPTDPRRTPTDSRRTPTDPRRTPDHRRSVDNYGRSPPHQDVPPHAQYGKSQSDQYARQASQNSHTPTNQYDRQPQQHRGSPDQHSTSPDRYSRSSDQYGRSPPDQYARSHGQYPRSHDQYPGSPNEPPIYPQQSSADFSQPPGPTSPLGYQQSGRRSSGGSTYKVTDLDSRETWDITQVDIRSPVDDRPVLSPGEVLPRRDPTLMNTGPLSHSDTPSDSEVAELTMRSQPPPLPTRSTDSYNRAKQQFQETEEGVFSFDPSVIGAMAPPGGVIVDPSPLIVPEPPAISHGALQHPSSSTPSAFTPLAQIKDNFVVNAMIVGIESAPLNFSPPPPPPPSMLLKDPPPPSASNPPSSLHQTSSVSVVCS